MVCESGRWSASLTHFRVGIVPDLIDFGLSRDVEVNVNTETVAELYLDYNPVIYLLGGEVVSAEDAGVNMVSSKCSHLAVIDTSISTNDELEKLAFVTSDGIVGGLSGTSPKIGQVSPEFLSVFNPK